MQKALDFFHHSLLTELMKSTSKDNSVTDKNDAMGQENLTFLVFLLCEFVSYINLAVFVRRGHVLPWYQLYFYNFKVIIKKNWEQRFH